MCAADWRPPRQSHAEQDRRTIMHPIIQRDLMQARVADLCREAERVRLTREVGRARRTRNEDRWLSVLRHPGTVLVRRLLAALGADSLRQPEGATENE